MTSKDRIKSKIPQITGKSPAKTYLFVSKIITSSNLLLTGSEHRVTIKEVIDGPFLFTVQLLEHDKKLELLNSYLKSDFTESNQKFIPYIGMRVNAKMRRAIILNIKSDGNVSIYLQDYGTTTDCNVNDIKPLSNRCREFEPMAKHFRLIDLQNIPHDKKTGDLFKNCTLGKELKLIVRGADGPGICNYCELFIGGNSLISILRKNLRYSFVQLKQGLEHQVEIIHTDNQPPWGFVCRLWDSQTKLERLYSELTQFCEDAVNSSHEGSILFTGQPVAAKVNETWYRGIIKAECKSSDTFEVYLVDLGVNKVVPKAFLREISPHFVDSLSAQAINCKLQLLFSSNDALECFKKITSNCLQYTLNVKEIIQYPQCSEYTVHLHCHGFNISEIVHRMIGGVTDKAKSSARIRKVISAPDITSFALEKTYKIDETNPEEEKVPRSCIMSSFKVFIILILTLSVNALYLSIARH